MHTVKNTNSKLSPFHTRSPRPPHFRRFMLFNLFRRFFLVIIWHFGSNTARFLLIVRTFHLRSETDAKCRCELQIMGRQQKYVVVIRIFNNLRCGIIVIVDFIRAGVRWRLQALFYRRPQVRVNFRDAVLQVAHEPLFDPGVQHRHCVRVRRLQVPLHLSNAICKTRPVLVHPLRVQTAVPLKMTHRQLQNIRLLQLGMFRVVRFCGIQDERLEGGQTLVDSSPASLLHEWLICASWFRSLVLGGHHRGRPACLLLVFAGGVSRARLP